MLNIFAARANSISSDPLEAAINWLYTYIESSMSMQDRYLDSKFVKSHLAPFYKIVAQPKSAPPKLYRVLVGSGEVGSSIQVKPINNKVMSWTSIATRKGWQDLADEVGLDTERCVVVQTSQKLDYLVTPEWAVELLAKLKAMKIVKQFPDSRAKELLEWKPSWQKEFIISATTIKAVIVYKFD